MCILNFQKYKRTEELLLDIGLAKSMEEIMDEEEIDLKEAISFYEKLKMKIKFKKLKLIKILKKN